MRKRTQFSQVQFPRSSRVTSPHFSRVISSHFSRLISAHFSRVVFVFCFFFLLFSSFSVFFFVLLLRCFWAIHPSTHPSHPSIYSSTCMDLSYIHRSRLSSDAISLMASNPKKAQNPKTYTPRTQNAPNPRNPKPKPEQPASCSRMLERERERERERETLTTPNLSP